MRLLELTEDQIAELKAYLNKEIQNHQAERGDLETRWTEEANDFWAEANLSPSDLPNTGFATLMVPLTAIAAEAVHARAMGMIYALEELVVISVAERYDDLRPGLDKFFNHQFLDVLRFRERTESALLELEKHGTGIISVGHRTVKKKRVKEEDGKEIEVPIYTEEGVCIDSISISDFLMPFVATDVKTAPWVGNYVRMHEREIRQAEATGLFYEGTADKLCGHYAIPNDDEVLQQVRKESNTVPLLPAEVRFCRIFCDLLLEDEIFEIEVYYDEMSGVLAHASYADARPYIKGVYMPLENRWYGYGIAKQNKEFQVEVTTQHRQRIDNATIANMSMFKVKNSARSYIKDDEQMFPGKKFYVENMDDIEPLQIGDVKASAYNNENQVIVYSQQRTGVNELTQGMPNVGTPGTASDTLARIQESNRKFDYNFSNQKSFLTEVAYQASQQIIQNEAYDKNIFSYIQKGGEVESFLKNKKDLKHKYIFNIALAGAKNNKVLDRNTYTQLVGMHTQYCTSSLDLLKEAAPQAVPEATKQILASNNILYMHILNAFDIPNPDKLILKFDALFQIPAAPPEIQRPNQGVPGVAQGQPSGPSSLLAPNANINFDGGPPALQLQSPNLSLAG